MISSQDNDHAEQQMPCLMVPALDRVVVCTAARWCWVKEDGKAGTSPYNKTGTIIANRTGDPRFRRIIRFISDRKKQ